MSPRSSSPKKKAPKGPPPPADIYFSLLVVSVAALAWGIFFLVKALNEYAWTLSGGT